MSYDPRDDDDMELWEMQFGGVGDMDKETPKAKAPEAPQPATKPGTAPIGKKKVRVKVMGEGIAKRFPTIATMLLTKTDGTQILLIRR